MATPDRSYRKWSYELDDTGRDALIQDYARTTSTESLSRKRSNCCLSLWSCILVSVAIIVLFLAGFCLGYYVHVWQKDTNEIHTYECTSLRTDRFNNSKLERVHDRIMYFLARDPMRMVKFASDFNNEDPTTHSTNEHRLEQLVEQEFEDYGLDSVDVLEYSVPVTFPTKANHLQVIDIHGAVVRDFNLVNSARGNNSGSYAHFPYVAYTLGGSVKGPLVYGHYGRQSDLLSIHKLGAAVLLLRLGLICVAEKLENAEAFGAAGVLFYWDPEDKGMGSPSNQSVVPYVSAGSDSTALFTIPAQTVSADQAAWLLGRMAAILPAGLNITNQHRAGNVMVNLTTYNQKKELFTRNVVGCLHGYSEPDSYVVVGAPRSSFPDSSVDALSSTALLLQLARSLQYVQKTDQWQPRRGIKLVSWGSAEFSNVGMRQYISSNRHLLSRRTVAYIDLSQLVAGNHSIVATTVPAFNALLKRAAAKVPNPLNPETTIQEDWDRTLKDGAVQVYTQDVTRNPFLHMVGVPEIHLQYRNKLQGDRDVDAMKKLDVHHHLKYHIAVSRVAAVAMLDLVDDYILPYSIKDYAESLHVAVWQTSESLKECSKEFRDLGPELSLTDHLSQTALAFNDFINIYRNNHDVMGLKSVNDVKMLFEEIFVSEYLLGKRFSTHHVLYPALPEDGSIKFVHELCRVARKTGNWDIIDLFQHRFYSILHETMKSMRFNE